MADENNTNYWFIRLGSDSDPEDKRLYQALAEEHDIVKIGYDIRENITKHSRGEIEKYFSDIHNYKGRRLGAIVSLVNNFINGIKFGDTIICPFDGGYMRIGLIISNCETVETLFNDYLEEEKEDEEEEEKNLRKFLQNYPGSQPNPEIKPARNVRWLTPKLSQREFPNKLQEALAKPMRRTITDLKIEEIIDLSDSNNLIKSAAAKYAEARKIESGRTEDDTDSGLQEANSIVDNIENMLDTQREKETQEEWIAKTIFTIIITATITGIINKILDSCGTGFWCISSAIAVIMVIVGLVFVANRKGLLSSWFRAGKMKADIFEKQEYEERD